MQMQAYPGRKTLLLVSGGMLASDSPGGRPDLGSLGLQVGREAAAANTAIYTLFIDSSLHDQFAAETRTGDRTSQQPEPRYRRARALARAVRRRRGRRALHRAGWQRLGRARAHSHRAVFLLPARRRTDGRRPRRPDSRSRGQDQAAERHDSRPALGDDSEARCDGRAGAGASHADDPGTGNAGPTRSGATPRRAPGRDRARGRVRSRQRRRLPESARASRTTWREVIRGFRQSDSPWPADRRRTAVFALELALAGLRSDIRDTREKGARLLAEYHVRVREPAGADDFECWWFVTEASALEGLFNAGQRAAVHSPRHCSVVRRVHGLTSRYAVVSEQQWLRGAGRRRLRRPRF